MSALPTLLLLSLSVLDVATATAPKVVRYDFRQEPAVEVLNPHTHRFSRRAKTVETNIENAQNNLLYLMNITVGTPAQAMSLQLDTGSSDIWVPYTGSEVCSKTSRCSTNGAFNSAKSTSFIDLAQDEFSISYVDGTKIRGDYIADTFGIGHTNVINMTMGLAQNAVLQDSGSPFQGIIGVGYQAGQSLAAQNPDAVYPTVVDQMKAQGQISALAYSLWLNDLESKTGSILFGGVDTAKYEGDLVGLPVMKDAESGTFSSFTVVLDNMDVSNAAGKSQFSRSNMALPVILDSGTTLTYLPDDVAETLYQGVGVVNDPTYGQVVPCSLASTNATLTFGFGAANGPKIRCELSQFVVPFDPRYRPTFKSSGRTACRWGIRGSGSDPNLFGDTFLRSAYVVYDLEKNLIGLAQTTFNATTEAIEEISPSSVPGLSVTASGTSVSQTFTGILHTTASAPSASAASALEGAGGTSTFDLGSAASASTKASGTAKASGGAAASIRPPGKDITTTVFGFLALLASAVGGSMLVLL